MDTKRYNKTQLDPLREFNNHIFHRDQFAHYLRWSYVLKIVKIGATILDLGCGSGNLAELLYRNRYKPRRYLGIDIRKSIISKDDHKFKDQDNISFIHGDLCTPFYLKAHWDIICCFEVIEHIGKENISKILDNIEDNADKDTIILISTPCFNGSAAKNHIIDGVPQEFTYEEIHDILEKRFIIEEVYGTFASQKDYKDKMDDKGSYMFERLSRYYDSNLISVIMAPLFPEYSRNCIWRLKKRC